MTHITEVAVNTKLMMLFSFLFRLRRSFRTFLLPDVFAFEDFRWRSIFFLLMDREEFVTEPNVNLDCGLWIHSLRLRYFFLR